MAPVSRADCRAIVPLLARYNDPDLSEAERVRLSLHLYCCRECLARLQEYRALDQRLRVLPPITMAPRVRAAVLERVAATSAPAAPTVALTWRAGWPALTAVLSLTALILVVGLTTISLPRGVGGFATAGVTSETFARPLATTFLAANPTRVVGLNAGISAGFNESLAVKLPIAKPQPTRPAAVAATIRAIDPATGRIVVTVDGARADERMAVHYDTAIVLADGRPGTLADLVIGAQIRLQREASGTGGIVAREIVIPR